MAGSFLTVGRLFSRMYTQGASSDVSIVPERDYCIAFNHGWKSAQNLIAEYIGFIGLGNMGLPMARNLMAKGHKLVVYDTVKGQVEAAVADGAVAATGPSDVAKQSTTICTMLPASEHVSDVYTSPGGIFSSVQAGSLLIDCSTIDGESAIAMSKLAREKNTQYVDAPVSGGVGAATNGVLTFMLGGPSESYERAKPLLEKMGKNVFHCGDHGAGQATKICNNMLLAIEMIGTSEVLLMAQKLGLDPKMCSKVINASSGRSWSCDTYNPCPGVMENVPSSRDYEGGFGTGLMRKDLNLAQSAAIGSKSVTPMGSLALHIYNLMCQHGYEKKDFSSVYKFLEQ